MNSRQRRAVFVVGLVLGAVVVPTVGALVSSVYPIPATGTVAFETNSGLIVRYETAGGDLSDDIPFRDDETLVVNSSTGNFTASAPAAANVTVEDPTGVWTNTSITDVSGTNVTINPADKKRLTIHGNPDEVDWQDYQVGSGAQFYYSGGSGTTTLTFYGLPANTTIGAQDINTDTLLDSGTTDSNGNLTLTLPNSAHTATLTTSTDGPTFANPSPTSPINDDPVTLSVDVDDADFSDGDNVTVTIDHDGSQVKQTTISSAQTVDYTLNTVTGGDHTWTVTAEDSFGNTNTESYTYSVPDTLFIRNETNASQLVKSPTTVETTFFAENGSVYERQTDTGKVDMKGLPADQEFTVRADAPGYYSRTVTLPSLLEQETVYLLNTSVATADVEFRLDDSTGEFPASETILYVDKAINRSGNVKFRTIVSDRFGAANEVKTTLENGQRYRLRVENPEGDTRTLGEYVAAGDDVETLPIGQVKLAGDTQKGTSFAAEIVETGSGRALRLQYRDPTDSTDDLRIEITEVGTGDTVRANSSESGPYGTYTETIPIPNSDAANATYEIQYHANRTGEADVGDTLRRGEVADVAGNRWNIDGQVLSLMGYSLILGVTGLLVIINGALAALGGTVTATILTFVGVVSIPMPLIGLAGAVSLLFNIGSP